MGRLRSTVEPFNKKALLKQIKENCKPEVDILKKKPKAFESKQEINK